MSMTNIKKGTNMSQQEEENLIYDLLDKGFTQKKIEALFDKKYTQTKISNMKKLRDTYNEGRKDAEQDIKNEVYNRVMQKESPKPLALFEVSDK